MRQIRSYFEAIAFFAFVLLVLSCAGYADPAYAQQAYSGQSAPIAIAGAGTTQVVTGVSRSAVHVTSYALVATAANVVTWEYGTGTNCGTGTTTLSGAMSMSANEIIPMGDGIGTLLFVPPGQNLCVLTTAALQGHLSYQLF